MTDKFDEAAIEWNDECPMMILPEGYLYAAFRWYDEHYVQPAIDAAKAKENKTCDCLAKDVEGRGYSHCHYCGRRIKEVLR